MPFLGQPLIVRIVARLAPLATEVLVTTNRPADYAFLGLPLFADEIFGRGALGGLYTALRAARCEQVAVVACDMPFVSPALLRWQAGLLEAEAVDIVVPQTGARFEPFHAVYRRGVCLPVVEAAIRAGAWKAVDWFPRVRVRPLRPEECLLHDPRGLAFLNINTPEAWQRAEALARLFDN